MNPDFVLLALGLLFAVAFLVTHSPQKDLLRASISGIVANCLVLIWWLVVTAFVVDPFLIYENVANPKSLSQVPAAWRTIRSLSSFSRAALYLPFLIFYPHSHCLVSRQNWLLHGIGITALALGLVSLFVEKWSKDTALDVLDAEGIISGRASVVYLGMLLLATSRRSAVLNIHGFGYLDLIAFHRAAGWWCVAMSLIHSLAYFVFYLVEGGWSRLWSACFPTQQCFRDGIWKQCVNRLGLVNFVGVIGTVATIILAVFSREQVRRRIYEHFYFIHLATAFFFVLFVALHDFPTMILAFAGLAFYIQDRWTARRTRSCFSEPGEVTAEIVCQDPSSKMALLTWRAASAGDLLPGSRWVYLFVENMATAQWHPFSVMQSSEGMHVLVKDLGDWTSSLCDLVASGATLQIKVEGPFGRPLCKPDASSHTLLLVAGGVGISPFVDLLCHMSKSWWQKVKLIWAVRHHEYAALSMHIDLESLSQVADIAVFITSEGVDTIATPTPAKHRVTAPLDSADSAKLQNPGSYRAATLVLCCTTITALAYVSYLSREKLEDAYYDQVTTLTGYTLAFRVAPVSIAVLLAVLSGAVLRPVHTLRGSNNSATSHGQAAWGMDAGGEPLDIAISSDQNLSALPVGQPSPQVYFAKPDLQEEIEREAQLGGLDVQVCGPARMTSSVQQAAKLLNKRGLKIHVDAHDSAL